jgi:hypothetical protein
MSYLRYLCLFEMLLETIQYIRAMKRVNKR